MQDMRAGYAKSEGLALETLIEWTEAAEEATDDARQWSERDRDYYDGTQLTAAERKVLRERGQPDVVINRIKPKIDFLLGYEAANRTDPRAFPRTPQDEGAAEAATDALRYVADRTELDSKFSGVWENMLVEGFGAVELVINEATQEGGDPEIDITVWPWDRLFYDPHSRKLDFSDARYLGGYVWMDAEEAKAQYPNGADAIDQTISGESAHGTAETYEDRPRWKTWVSGKARKRVRIVQMYYQDPKKQWHYCVFCRGGKLDSFPVPFQDQDGMSWCPLIMQSAYVNRENDRYGMVRALIDVQDEINKRRSKSLHRLTMRQVVYERGAVDDEDMARTELAKPDGLVAVNPGFRFELLSSAEQLQAELALLQESKNEIELLGPNAAMLGKDGDAPSGKAIQLNQMGGQTEITLLIDRYRHMKQRVFRRIWDLIRQFKREEWWIRVTDNSENVRFIGFNRPVSMSEELAKRLEQQGQPPEQIQQQLQMLAQDPYQSQMLQQTVRIENQPTRMWMDITLEEVPDYANTQEEQFQALVQLAPAVTFPPEVYLKASTLRNKDELLEQMKSGGQKPPEQIQLENQMQQMTMQKAQLELEKLAAEVAEKNANVAKIQADAIKARVEADMAAMPQGVIEDPAILPPPQPLPPDGAMPMDQVQAPPENAGLFSAESVPPPGFTGVPPMPPPGT